VLAIPLATCLKLTYGISEIVETQTATAESTFLENIGMRLLSKASSFPENALVATNDGRRSFMTRI
jgi:hypothetical protein